MFQEDKSSGKKGGQRPPQAGAAATTTTESELVQETDEKLVIQDNTSVTSKANKEKSQSTINQNGEAKWACRQTIFCFVFHAIKHGKKYDVNFIILMKTFLEKNDVENEKKTPF